jgi:hypothetical protein
VSLIGDLPKKEEAPAAKPDPEKAATEEIKANYKATVADVKVELPEGVVVDPQVLSDVKALALEELTPSQRAQKTLELGLRQLQSFQSEAKSAFKQAVDGWREATMADKEIGGAKFPEAQKLANKAIAALGGQPLADILRQSGLANHPAVVKAFARAGTTVIEDTVAGTLQSPVPNAGPQTQADQAAALGYGKMSSELRARRK